MNTQEIANRLAELCRSGEFEQAQQELYADDVVSTEPIATAYFDKETKGKENVLAKIRKFLDLVDTLYSNEIGMPIIYGNAIAFTSVMDIKMKGKDRMKMGELCVYVVKDGKVISEQFFL